MIYVFLGVIMFNAVFFWLMWRSIVRNSRKKPHDHKQIYVSNFYKKNN